jgi:subtilase family protein
MADTGSPVAEPRPLLAFGEPRTQPIPPRDGPAPFRRVRSPGAGRQGIRLAPQFEALQDAIADERAQLSDATTSPDPELVAVFDLAGTVDGFMRACAEVDGLEFLADLQEDQVAADDDFYYEDVASISDDAVPQSLYMVMSNAQAVNELVRLFGLWQQNPSITFATGLNPLKQVFELLRGIRRWGPEDRVRETGLLERWEEDVALIGRMNTARVEVELWFRSNAADRLAAQSDVERLVASAGGRTIRTSTIAEIHFHGVLADIPYGQVQAVLDQGPAAIELLTAEGVMFVTPARPMAIPTIQPTEYGLSGLSTDLPTAAPRVALIDGLPLASHVALNGRLVIDDPDDRALNYTSGQQQHGSAMASLIIHGDLSAPGQPINGALYVRPIMQPHPWVPEVETVLPDELLVDLIHRTFHRMFEGDGTHPPTAPSVRVINLSIGDPARMFVRRLSPLAKLLDWLSHKYNLVTVVSAGNHAVSPTVPRAALADADRLCEAVARAHHTSMRHHRLLSPGEAVNVVTVGAQHADGADVVLPDTVLDAFDSNGPASYSATGFGFRRSVKPEVLLPGGREIFVRPPDGVGDVELLPAATEATGPGIRVASPGNPGALNGTAYTYGSSNAAALATRTIDHIFESLSELQAEAGEYAFPDAQYHPVLAKTLLVHAAHWGNHGMVLRDRLGLTAQQRRRELTQLLGYGPVHADRIASADRVRAVLIGASSIGKDKRQTFQFPLPPVLAATTQWRRLTITLGWLSPVNTRSQKHRMARLSFQPPRSELGVDPIEADHNAVLRGTVQHQVLEGQAAVAFTSGDSLAINIDCRVDAGRLDTPVRYAIAASIEIGAAVQADVHAQVRQGLRQRVRQQAGEQIAVR